MANSLDKVFDPNFKQVINSKTGLLENIRYVDDVRNLFESNRNYLSKELRQMDLPIEPLHSEGGYFLIADVTKCKNLIPEKYLTTHDY